MIEKNFSFTELVALCFDSEKEILQTLDESYSFCSSFPHLCSTLLKMIETPLDDDSSA